MMFIKYKTFNLPLILIIASVVELIIIIYSLEFAKFPKTTGKAMKYVLKIKENKLFSSYIIICFIVLIILSYLYTKSRIPRLTAFIILLILFIPLFIIGNKFVKISHKKIKIKRKKP
jgi:uncharacterized membrane protein